MRYHILRWYGTFDVKRARKEKPMTVRKTMFQKITSKRKRSIYGKILLSLQLF